MDTRTEKMQTKFDFSQLYFIVLDDMKKGMLEDESVQKQLAVPFTLTCAAALECFLNDNLIGQTWTIWQEEYRPLAEAYMTMSLRGKLDAIVPLLSRNEFILKQDHQAYGDLKFLISRRNKLTHNKEHFRELGVEIVGTAKWRMPQSYIDEISDITFGLNRQGYPYRFYDSLRVFELSLAKMLNDAEFYGDDLIVTGSS